MLFFRIFILLLSFSFSSQGFSSEEVPFHGIEVNSKEALKLLCGAARDGKEALVKRVLKKLFPGEDNEAMGLCFITLDPRATLTYEIITGALSVALIGGHIGVVKILLEHAKKSQKKHFMDESRARALALKSGNKEQVLSFFPKPALKVQTKDLEFLVSLLRKKAEEGVQEEGFEEAEQELFLFYIKVVKELVKKGGELKAIAIEDSILESLRIFEKIEFFQKEAREVLKLLAR